VIRVLFLQCLKHQIHRILVLFVILADLHGVDKLDQSREVLLLDQRLIVDISDQRTIQQSFRLIPERIAPFAFAFRVCHERRDQLQDILFAVHIGERIVVHRLLEIDRIEDLDPVLCPHKGVPHLD